MQNKKNFSISTEKCESIFDGNHLYYLPICNKALIDKNTGTDFQKTKSFSADDFIKNKCEYFNTGKASIYFCSKNEDGFLSKTIDNAPSLVISLLAVSVSLGTLYFMRRQDERNFIRSIDDEYILRKIISPNIIEPIFSMTRDIVGLISKLPRTSNDKHLKNLEIRLNSYSQEIRALQSIIDSLNLLDNELRRKINSALMKYEDAITEAAYFASAGKIPNTHLSNSLGIFNNSALEAVRAYQVGILKEKKISIFYRVKRFLAKKTNVNP